MPMSTSARNLFAVGALTALVGAAAGAEIAATHREGPPDFSKNLAGWQATGPDYQPVAGSLGPVGSDPAHPYFSNAAARRAGGQPTFRVADLTNPNLKPWAKAVMKRENDKVLAGGIGYTPRSSCMPAGVPAFMLFPVVEPIYFLQTPKQVTIVFSGDAQVRRIYLDVPIQVALMVDDPDTFNAPWTATYGFRRIERPMPYEEVCAENNQHLFDYHVPTADKSDF